MPAGPLFAVAFFLVLFFAAITSSVSMLEVGVSSLQEATEWSRQKTTFLLGLLVVAVGLPSALSYSAADLSLDGIRILDLMDETVGTLGLPLAGVVMAVAFTWFLPREILEEQAGRRAGEAVFLLCRYVIPPVLILTTVARFASGIDPADLRLLPGSPWMGALLQAEIMGGIALALIAVIALLCRFGHCPLGKRIRK